MTTRAADQYAEIARRQKELAEETRERVAGQALPIDLPDPVPEVQKVYGLYDTNPSDWMVGWTPPAPPPDDELTAFWQGLEWTPEKFARMQAHKWPALSKSVAHAFPEVQGNAQAAANAIYQDKKRCGPWPSWTYTADNPYQAPEDDPA